MSLEFDMGVSTSEGLCYKICWLLMTADHGF
jgi:hypothetical protein